MFVPILLAFVNVKWFGSGNIPISRRPPQISLVQPPPVVLVEMVRSPGWWYTYPSESYEFVSWDDEIPNIWEKTCSKPPTILIIPSTFFAG